jgi:hypothetical protein
VPISKPQPDVTLVKALARAWRWQRMLDDGVYASVSEIGDAENISKSYGSRILRLAPVAPYVVEAILEGRANHALVPGTASSGPQPAGREEQRGFLSTGIAPVSGTVCSVDGGAYARGSKSHRREAGDVLQRADHRVVPDWLQDRPADCA